jgi:mannosyltransferase OCH1-like enzyme
MKENKIPKIIHYCWFGKKEKSDLAMKCIESWRKILPDYKIMEWNEDNFNIIINKYVEEAYETKRYAFVADYVRLYALYNHGGIYLDTDIEIIKPFDDILYLHGFAGFEDKELISTATLGSEKNNKIIKELLEAYCNKRFIINGKVNTQTNVRSITNTLIHYGLIQNNMEQTLNYGGFTIFPTEYFSPLKLGAKTPKITEHTYTVHWFEGTWLTRKQRIKIKIIILVKSIIGFKNYNKLKYMMQSRAIE